MPLFKGKLDQDRKWLFMSYSRNGLESGPFRCFIRDQRWKLYSTVNYTMFPMTGSSNIQPQAWRPMPPDKDFSG